MAFEWRDHGLFERWNVSLQTGEVVPARYTYTYRWDGSTWLIKSHHSSALPEPE